MSRRYNCAIAGATGMVGRNFIRILEERAFPVNELYLFASARSAGCTIPFRQNEIVKELTVEALTPESFNKNIDFALFAVENHISREYAPIAAAAGCIVVDNSSAWRMDENVPLVVPEVNGADIKQHKGIIANPNCCAAPAVIALKPLQEKYGLERVVISTYQSVSGAGNEGIADLQNGINGQPPRCFPHAIANNIIPHIDRFNDDGYTGEETKIMQEIRKMLHQPDLRITATAARVPVAYGHSLSMNINLKKPFSLDELRGTIKKAPGVKLFDSAEAFEYPMPLHAAGTDEVYIGRLRRDESSENTLNMWVVTDNTRKGAALNAVQILEALIG